MRVLVVDDYPGAAEISCMLLEILGHEARHVLTGRDALACAAQFFPDVVILDIGLPDISGYDVARALRESPQGKDVYIAALTGWGQPEDRGRAVAAGIDQHFTKPASADKLRLMLAAAAKRLRETAIEPHHHGHGT